VGRPSHPHGAYADRAPASWGRVRSHPVVSARTVSAPLATYLSSVTARRGPVCARQAADPGNHAVRRV